MGEAKRKRDAAYRDGPWPGSDGRCPVCFGTFVLSTMIDGHKHAACGKCQEAWEAVDESQIWDREDPTCSFKEPCDNCAFRPGSPEQADKEGWKKLMSSLKAGGGFYCHKGVPLRPGTDPGFDYPKETRKLRLCRGYLNMISKHWSKDGIGQL